jgi:CheY-like chemotaxis protein
MKKRILVIEDNLTNLELICYLLTAFNYIPLHADNGLDGWALIQKEIPNLILCDIEIPLLNGLNLADFIKKDTKLRHIPLIALTALARTGDKEKILTNGFDGYISKPITPETFISEMEMYLVLTQSDLKDKS